MMNLDDAMNTFIGIVLKQAVEGTVDGMKTLLMEGPPGRVKDQRYLSLQKRFSCLNEDEKEFVLAVARESAVRSVFNLLVVLDNKVGYPIRGEVSDFALNLQTYESAGELRKYLPKEVIRINRSYSIDGDLHDKLTEIVSRK